MILTVDLGGTKTALCIWNTQSGTLQKLHTQKLSSKNLTCPAEAAISFLQERGLALSDIDAVCMCFAGAIEGNLCYLPNLGRTLDLTAIRAKLRAVSNVFFVNDLVAFSQSLPHLTSDDVTPLLSSSQPIEHGTTAVLASGTGLGEASVLPDGTVCPSEGSHGDFAACTERQWQLRCCLAAQYGGHVSYDRILSGPGILRIWKFLCTEKGRENKFSRPEEVTQSALDGDALAQETLSLFVTLLGAETGNLALRTLAFGGVYLGGGVIPPLLSWLQQPEFSKNFYNKGQLRPTLCQVPVYAITDPDAPSLGAAVIAQQGRIGRFPPPSL